ncbi:SWIM zinc finger family protein [Haloprofundus halobius]|uniref:SWIM zinc finger family protein n=1 Tax=Haloprofundus halobius TaxID=2876194 RepID=UPI001CCC3DEE|nr:SWIM zinc finger family protein [Haloprofundus halobius]
MPPPAFSNTARTNPDEHEYTVEVSDGIPAFCTCPADRKYSGACKHRVAVAIRRPVLEAAMNRVATDGGSVEKHTKDTESKRPDDCECFPSDAELPCWSCVESGRRSLD